MKTIFDEDGWKGIELNDGSHIYSRYNAESRKKQYYYSSKDKSIRRIIKKEIYDFLYEEQVDWSIENGIVCRKEYQQ